MIRNDSELISFPSYKLVLDDIEEIFLNTTSFNLIFILTLIAGLFTIVTILFLIYRATELFLSCIIPFIYALIIYDFIQLFSLFLLKYNLTNTENYFFGQLCRWGYYLKASTEAGQCLTIIFIFALRRQQVRYFLSHSHLPNSSPLRSRILTFVCLLFIVYVHNWITHLKVEKIHLITFNHIDQESTKPLIDIEELPLTWFGMHDTKLEDRIRFVTDLDRYARGLQQIELSSLSSSNSSLLPIISDRPIERSNKDKTDQIIHNQKDGSVHEIIIKFPYGNLFGQRTTRMPHNRTRRRRKFRRQTSNGSRRNSIHNNDSYYVLRCTYGQAYFLLPGLLTLVHAIFYLILIVGFLTTIRTFQVPYMTITSHQRHRQAALAFGRRKSAERHQQLILLTHLRRLQYLIVYIHALFALIRLIYVCLLILILLTISTPLKSIFLMNLFRSLFFLAYYSIPIRIGSLFIYLFLSTFASHLRSILYYIMHTKLSFSCRFQKPTTCFRLRFVPYTKKITKTKSSEDDPSMNSLVINQTSSFFDEHSSSIPLESMMAYNEMTNINPVTTTMLICTQPTTTVSYESISNVCVHAQL